MKQVKIDIFSDELSTIKDQLSYKEAFLKKFGDKIDANDPFYFDNVDIVDEYGETIKGVKLERNSWKQITNVLIKYFHLDL